ncbi:MAG: DNA translocase FtsK 4TM domain-containing protein [Candidatus Yonathbacteria bacterium]|nr:DNA translocase FtsK 4TM domain-containing protein [Candidatus Yonathbacteria bacterium]
MAKKETNGRKRTETKVTKKIEKTSHDGPSWWSQVSLFGGLSDETRHSVIAILFFVIGVFFSVAPFGKGGLMGSSIYSGFDYLLGVGYFALPLLLFLLGISFFRESRPNLAVTASVGAFLFLFSILGLVNIFSGDASGGILGQTFSYPLVKLFDTYIATLFLIAFLAISFLVMFNTRPSFSSLLFWRKSGDADGRGLDAKEDAEVEEAINKIIAKENHEDSKESAKLAQVVSKIKEIAPSSGRASKDGARHDSAESETMAEGMPLNQVLSTTYIPPPLSILEGDLGKPGVGDIKANANIIKRTLSQYGITVEMDEVSIGPSVTRYALKPAEGVKLSRIAGLQSELSYALAAHPIRIEAPIPGQSLVGIEVPNSTKTVVGLKTLFASDEYRESQKPLLLALGRGVSGKLYYADLAKMPHVLIAGATGSGKSVTIHTIVNSLLYRNGPEAMRFIMIDPKRVELTLYNKIPHLLTPVVTDAKKAILALKWAAKEMDRRYNVLEAESVRDISSYHKNVLEPAIKAKSEKRKAKKVEEENTEAEMPERMPYIVIILDELADIMHAYPRELESAIVRLAQMSRAVGIHLILSTQRPSVNVITGLIKANVPARVALQVSSQIDSRTILDASGAEKLLGAGDMLYISGEMSKPTRIQSAFMSETEVKAVVKYLAHLPNKGLPNTDEINLSSGSISNECDSLFSSSFDEDAEGSDDDDLYEDARLIIIEAGKASTSYLQRRLKVGYARAARLMDMLEDRNVIGPGDGAKPRQVLERPNGAQEIGE